jgi:NAD+ kinase
MNIKRIIILYKISAYSIYFERSGSSFCKNGKVSAREIRRFRMIHNTHHACLDTVEKIVKEQGILYKKVCRGEGFVPLDHDLVVTVGGDGTFLEGARILKQQRIIGVNSDPTWSVGRFCCATSETFRSILSNVLKQKAKILQFPRFELRVAGKRFNVLNDILFAHDNPAAMSRYVLTIGDKKEAQKSSGVWVSSAAGSSGAMKSAGGKQVAPTRKIIQYRPRELYVWRKKQYRLTGGILTDHKELRITSMMREGFVFLDGSHVSFPVGFGESIVISSSKFALNVVCC